jgi:Penicillin amidase
VSRERPAFARLRRGLARVRWTTTNGGGRRATGPRPSTKARGVPSNVEGRVENKFYAASGETIVCAIEFARVQRAQCLLGYGNATQPGSPHLEDQLPFMVQKRLLPVRRDKKEIEGDLKLRERVGGG